MRAKENPPRGTPKRAAVESAQTLDCLNESGKPYVTAWQVAPGCCKVQTNDPAQRERLRQRSDTRLQSWVERGDPFWVFTIDRPLSFTLKLAERYQAPDLRGPNSGFSGQIWPQSLASQPGRVTTAEAC